MSKRIEVTSLPEVHLEIDELHNFQGELKKMTDAARNKLRRSIIEEGFAMPVAFFENAGIKYILDGHQRLSVMQGLKKEGYDIPPIPAHEIKAKDYNHAKKILASFISQYGKITKEGFKDFFEDVDFNIFDDFEFPEVDADFIEALGDDFTFNDRDKIQSSDEDESEIDTIDEQDNFYSKKVEIPVYTAKGKKPDLGEIFDIEKYQELVTAIDAADVPKEEKIFLKFAAGRHIVFRYDKIAEYYCHSNETLQQLIEDSALVLIDFERAIEQGYVRMVDEIADQYRQERENQNKGDDK